MHENTGLTKKFSCLCCGKSIITDFPKSTMASDVIVECPYCGYEHIVEIRFGKIARALSTGYVDQLSSKIIRDWCIIEA